MQSATASPRQPIAPGELFQMDDYYLPDGKKAFSIQIRASEASRFYAEHPMREGLYPRRNGPFRVWNTCSGSLYIPGSVNDVDEGLDLMERFIFPPLLRERAMRASRYLQNVFSEIARLKVIRNLPEGREDWRKLPAMAEAFAAGDYDPNRLLPFRRIQPAPARLPTVAIVASAGNAEMWENTHYIPGVVTLAIGLLWACEAANLPTYAALCQGHYFGHNDDYEHMTYAHLLAAPNTTTSLNAYGYTMHRDLWRMGLLTASAADPRASDRLDHYDQLRAYSGASLLSFWPSLNGGQATAWARHMLGADLVIAIGEIEDRDDAEIQLSTEFNIEFACKEIARQAEQLKGKS